MSEHHGESNYDYPDYSGLVQSHSHAVSISSVDWSLSVERLERLTACLVTVKASLSDVDPLSQLREFGDFVENGTRLAELRGLTADRERDLDIFDVLHIHHWESVHSNFLAWLLDPKGNHFIGSHFLRRFLSCTVVATREQGITTTSLARIHAMDWSDIEVRREWRYIDILLLNRKEGFVCAIENKVWAEEGFDESGASQLAGYRETLAKEFPDFESHLVFLSPSGMESKSETERHFWVPADYVTIQQLVAEILNNNVCNVSPDVRWFLTQYETTLRSNIVPDDSEIGELVRQIYLEHRDVIELINRHKPDYPGDIKQILKEAISREEDWLLDQEGGAYIRFRPSSWDRFEALKTGNGWKPSPSLLLFEFYCPANPVGTAGPALVLGTGTDEAVRIRLFEAARQNPGIFNLRVASLTNYTHLHQGRQNLIEESDLSSKWADGSTQQKLTEWVRRFAESESQIISDAVTSVLEGF